jgi:signal transduction histidine kinase
VSQYQSLLNDTIIELDEILSRFSSILRISQIEMRNQQRGFHDIDLAQTARDVVELFDPSAEEKGIKLQLLANEGVPAFGDRDLLFDALSNLVDNAIKHGGDNNVVMIEVRRGASGPVVTVADHGPGIPADERKNVLKRFYRLERSRNSPGSGLGLSLVAAVANLHGAQIEMADNAPGLRIELQFPWPDDTARDRSVRSLVPETG